MPRLEIDSVIYIYMFICVALMGFNVLYIFQSKHRRRQRIRRQRRWEGILARTLAGLAEGGAVPAAHRRLLERRLRRLEELMAYHEAISPRLGQPACQAYLDACHDSFQALAGWYIRRPAMERAFFARLMALYHPGEGRRYDRMIELLLHFLDDSTVYCRENVLQALYAMGSAGGVEQALQRISQQGIYHNPRLLSDGLAGFAGDREALARRLWRRCPEWPEALQVAVVQFAAACTGALSGPFLEALQGADTPGETRFALIRYFRRRPSPAARPVLLELAGRQGDPLAIAACAALDSYPGPDTTQVLMAALHSRDWYVRRAAAASLTALGAGERELEQLAASGDQYAREMLAYMAEQNRKRGEAMG